MRPGPASPEEDRTHDDDCRHGSETRTKSYMSASYARTLDLAPRHNRVKIKGCRWRSIARLAEDVSDVFVRHLISVRASRGTSSPRALKAVRKAARPRDDWLFTLPTLLPSAAAVCSTERSSQ